MKIKVSASALRAAINDMKKIGDNNPFKSCLIDVQDKISFTVFYFDKFYELVKGVKIALIPELQEALVCIVPGEVIQTGSYSMSLSDLLKFQTSMKSYRGDVTIKVVDEKFHFVFGTETYISNVVNDPPALPAYVGEALDYDMDYLNKFLYAADVNGARPVLNALNITPDKITSSDGFMVVIGPNNGLPIMMPIAERFRFKYGKSKLYFIYATGKLASSETETVYIEYIVILFANKIHYIKTLDFAIEGYPQMERIIPTTFKSEVTVNSELLSQALKQLRENNKVQIKVEPKYNTIVSVLDFTAEHLQLTLKSTSVPSSFTEFSKIDYISKSLEAQALSLSFILNAKYLKEFLAHTSGDILIKIPADKKYAYLLVFESEEIKAVIMLIRP